MLLYAIAFQLCLRINYLKGPGKPGGAECMLVHADDLNLLRDTIEIYFKMQMGLTRC
jgi:hypothetical protein